ncbi:MAG: putative Na+/H+ antiporter [Deltaproteobacteria bacterium]|nr:putative Na+/H+ antiporter [Deltaproteobacteria bacterium]
MSHPTTLELVATILFAVALLHTFSVKRFASLAQRFPTGSIGENAFHLLSEVEVVFGLWATIFLLVFVGVEGGGGTIAFLEGKWTQPGAEGPVQIGFTEPLFVFVIMAMAATRPVLHMTRLLIENLSRLVPLPGALPFFVTCFTVGPLLGSFITEPAAMTVTALLLKERIFDRQCSMKLRYAMLGLLFVNISIGGTMTAFAAPPVVMVAAKWDLDTLQMIAQFGWKAAVAIGVSTWGMAMLFRRELGAMSQDDVPELEERRGPPLWLMLVHLVLIAAVVVTSHHPVAFIGIFLFFLGVTDVTNEHQDELKLRESLLVAYFLMGLVVLGALQRWWLEPTITSLSDVPLYLGATGLTAVTDNAALTYLGSLVPDLAASSQYALLAGAVTGGGLTVIANAPNPAGYGILKGCFGPTGVSPINLLLGALGPTLVAMLAFLLLPSFV